MTSPATPLPWRILLDTLPQGVVVADAEGRFTEVNAGACGILGCTREQLLGSGGLLDPGWNALGPDGAPLPPDAYPGLVALRTRKPVVQQELGLVRPGRALLWVAITAGPLPDGGVVMTFEDISERRRATERLRASEQFYRDLLERQGEGFGVVDGSERFIFANSVADTIFGVPRGTLVGRNLFEFLEPDQQHEALRQTRLRMSGVSATYDLRIRHGDGEARLLQVTVTPRPAIGEEPFAVIGVFRDITELRRAEAALRASEEKFSKAFHSSPDSVNINRLEDGVYLAVNDGFTRITGFTPEEVVGRSSLPGDLGIWTREVDRRRLQEGLRRDGMVPSLEAVFRRKDGTLVTGLMSASLIEMDGEPCVLSITRDISERKRAEEEKARLQAQLMQAQKMEGLGTLAGGIAHDMNNVLGAILGMATAHLEVQAQGSAVHKAFDTIAQAALRGGKMVKSLLSFARKNPAEERDLDLNAILREQAQLLERTTFARITLRTDLDPELRPVRGDAGALTHALMNLCLNAVDALQEQGTLILKTRNLEPGWVEVLVEDTGCGMPREVLSRALDPFFTTKPVGKGTGLGLSMAYSTVQSHQGRMEITSAEGSGTCVRLCFPASQAAPEAPDGTKAPPGGGGRSLDILLVDDDELIQDSLRVLLETLGHRVGQARSGEAALLKLEVGGRPDLVILDLNMPGLGGRATLDRLRALRPGLPVVLATGRADQAAMDLAGSHPGLVLLPKPFTLEDLARVLDGLAVV